MVFAQLVRTFAEIGSEKNILDILADNADLIEEEKRIFNEGVSINEDYTRVIEQMKQYQLRRREEEKALKSEIDRIVEKEDQLKLQLDKLISIMSSRHFH
jgi:multidrug efflux pump subunit AcrA (membrane-fusion protein)